MNLHCIQLSLAIAASLAAGAVQSRQAMVSVDLSEVASQLAQRNSLDESLMPLSILVPREVAAKVCGSIRPRTLTAAGCTASSSSTELGELVKGRMKADEFPPTTPPTRQPATD